MIDDVCLPAPVAADGSTEELYRWLGRREAFSVVAGRCSAADVECLRRIRDEKLYASRAGDWEEFCGKYLHMSRARANQLIALLEKFGPEYFQITQITRIPAADYHHIAKAVSSRGLEWNGAVIPIAPENSDRLAFAVSSLIAAAGGDTGEPGTTGLEALDAAGQKLMARYREMGKRLGRNNYQLSGSIAALQRSVERLIMEIG